MGESGPKAKPHRGGEVLFSTKDVLLVRKLTSTTDDSDLRGDFEIPYYHSLGWLQGQGLNGSLIRDPDAWEELSKKECHRIQDMGGFDPNLVSFATYTNNMGGTATKFRQHAYVKCLMGGAAADMAWGYLRGCV